MKNIKLPPSSEVISDKTFIKRKEERSITIVAEGAESCPRCKSKRTISVDIQKRSADEAMTTIFECSECHGKWQV